MRKKAHPFYINTLKFFIRLSQESRLIYFVLLLDLFNKNKLESKKMYIKQIFTNSNHDQKQS